MLRLTWGGQDNDADVEMSNAFQQEVAKPVSDSSDAPLEQVLLLQDAREEVLPSYLQPKSRTWTVVTSAEEAMQAMKARELEHVRWRAARHADSDP